MHRARSLLWLRHAVLVLISVVMLAPFYWVVKTSITGENIYAYPPHLWPVKPQLFNYVDVWYLIPFPRYLLNSVIVSLIAVAGKSGAECDRRLRADAAVRGATRDDRAAAVLRADTVPGDDHSGLSDHREAGVAEFAISGWRCR